MTELQLTPVDRCMNILKNYYIQFFQHNNKTINEQGEKIQSTNTPCMFLKLLLTIQLLLLAIQVQTLNGLHVDRFCWLYMI
jgi:hypothetical protein